MSTSDQGQASELQAPPHCETDEDIAKLKADALRAFNLRKMAQLDFYRAIKPLTEMGLTVREIAVFLDTSPSAVDSALEDGKRQEPVVEGQVAGSVTEVIQRHAAGMIDEDTMMDILVNWPYTPEDPALRLDPDGPPSWNTPAEVGFSTPHRLTREQYRRFFDLYVQSENTPSSVPADRSTD